MGSGGCTLIQSCGGVPGPVEDARWKYGDSRVTGSAFDPVTRVIEDDGQRKSFQ